MRGHSRGARLALITVVLLGGACSAEKHQASLFAFNDSEQIVILDVRTEDHQPLRVVEVKPGSGGLVGVLPGEVLRATVYGAGCVYLGEGPIIAQDREAIVLIDKGGQPWNSDMSSDVGVEAKGGGSLPVVEGCPLTTS